jgi:hypothetical protein
MNFIQDLRQTISGRGKLSRDTEQVRQLEQRLDPSVD